MIGGHRFLYGGDYNPEQWPEPVWTDDVARMREAGVTTATVGVFSWADLQPRQGAFEFGWLDRVLDLLHAGGIGVDLATATASPPPWAGTGHPDLYAVDERGARYWHGSRQHYAPTSVRYRRLAAELVHAMAERYVDHPAVQMWHVNNEYGCHVALDHSASAERAFREWLQDRYLTIGGLNDAWGTSFWSQRYGTFDEVTTPRHAPYSRNPAQVLDFRRFSSDALLECYLAERDVLRAAGAIQPITTNFIGFNKNVDYRTWAPEIDVVSDDCYPDPAHPDGYRHGAFERDLVRGLSPDRPWLLMEQASSAVNWRPRNAPKSPGQMAAWSMQSIARGADGILFFQWRQSRAGAEKFHSAMLPHAGTGTRTWREVCALGARLRELPALPAAAPAPVALVHEWENWWALEGTDHPADLDHQQVLTAWHLATQDEHLACDVTGAAGPFGDRRVVLAPALYLLRAEAAAALVAFVTAGGTLVLTSFSDVVDECDRLREGGFLTQLRDIAGIEVLEHAGVPDDAARAVGQLDLTLGGIVEDVEAREATVLARFTDGPYAGGPALTRKTHASGGSVVYAAGQLDRASARAVLQLVVPQDARDPDFEGLPEDVEAVRRGGVVFVVNHAAHPVHVRVGGTDLDLESQEVAVLDGTRRV
ncbi:beta-galactosidase [Modestobacter sp. Leaf380]|uniref:beta-galactosidase n=1 Tax=Modestobacter sp. Leaf380 TaxID=1736356 RepID=UPI000700F973|nr:beta-galactosidase [Modestobacter sp. Leaf380]KQS72120.1 hypothetical protein ASG41_18830 [Modestobacter sp. Leaf380]